MNTNFASRRLGTHFLLASLLVLLAIGMTGVSRVALAASNYDTNQASSVASINAIDVVMDNIYEKYGSLTRITDQGDVADYRWLAMARFFLEQNVFSSTSEAGTVAAVSLSTQNAISGAMDQIVQKYGSLTRITDPGDIAAYRWLAMALAYEK